MQCVVLRPFPGPEGRTYQIGERVNTKRWKNREVLIRARYIQPASLSSGTEQEVLDAPEPEAEFAPSPVARREGKRLKKKKRRPVVEEE